MTAAELKALDLLGKRFDDFREDNREGHGEIKKAIEGVEERLTAKLAEKDDAIKAIAVHCKDRQTEVDAALARALVATDAHIARAKLDAVAEATKPSVYQLATRGALAGIANFAAKAAIVVGLIAACWALLDKAGLL